MAPNMLMGRIMRRMRSGKGPYSVSRMVSWLRWAHGWAMTRKKFKRHSRHDVRRKACAVGVISVNMRRQQGQMSLHL